MVQSPSWEANWFAASQEIPPFHGTRRFITALTSVRHLSLSWARPIQSTYPHPTSWRSVLILSTHLRLSLPGGLFPSGFPTKTLYTPSPHPYSPHAQPISFFSILSPAQYWVRSTIHLAPRYAISSIPHTQNLFSFILQTSWKTGDVPHVFVFASSTFLLINSPTMVQRVYFGTGRP